MISIVVAYYNRKSLFINTLHSIQNQNNPHLLEIIAVDDGSDEHERLEDLTIQFPFLKIIRLERKNKWYQNSCIPYNIGFKAAKGDIIVIQNPECLHYGDVLNAVEQNISSTNYLTFSCFSLDKHATDNINTLINQPDVLEKIMTENSFRAPHFAGAAGWYNHSTIYPMARHYCCAITKKNLYKFHGFDERFAMGIAADDDEFIERIKLKLQVDFIDRPLVFHQNHYHEKSTSYQNRENKRRLHVRNLYMLENKIDFFPTVRLLWNAPLYFKKFIIQAEFKLTVFLRILFPAEKRPL